MVEGVRLRTYGLGSRIQGLGCSGVHSGLCRQGGVHKLIKNLQLMIRIGFRTILLVLRCGRVVDPYNCPQISFNCSRLHFRNPLRHQQASYVASERQI